MDLELLRADLQRIIGESTADSDGSIFDVLQRLDAIARSSLTPERLKHYLSKRSYVKALAWLDDPSTPHYL
jgi:hypothetical protein